MRIAPAILAVLMTVGAAGCGGAATKSSSTAARSSSSSASIALSSDFESGATIARTHTCDGQDVSPPLNATGLPDGTREIVVVMRDPDAPGGDFIHWAIGDLHPRGGSLSLPAGAAPSAAVLGRNSFGSLGYRGPCPPSGAPHHYVITLYALGQPSGLRKGFSAGDLTGLPVVGQGTLTGLYGRG